MKLTLEILKKTKSCRSGKRYFIKTYGLDAEVDAKQIFLDLASVDREQFIKTYNANPEHWLSWLGYYIPGFLESIGNETRGEFGNFTSGHHAGITVKFTFFSGQSSGEFYGQSSGKFSGQSSGKFYDQSTGLIYENYSADVVVSILSDMACVVDRRNKDRPVLILKKQGPSDNETF